MIASLKGSLEVKEPNRIVVAIGGVGYEVTIPLSTYYRLAEVGGLVELQIHTHVREDALSLFGFLTTRERTLFRHLISISGVGPRMGIAILSGLAIEDIILAISEARVAELSTIPGVGKKTAERLVLELKEKVAGLSAKEQDDLATRVLSGEGERKKEDLVSALVNLGYKRSLAEKAADRVMGGNHEEPLEVLLRKVLRNISGKG